MEPCETTVFRRLSVVGCKTTLPFNVPTQLPTMEKSLVEILHEQIQGQDYDLAVTIVFDVAQSAPMIHHLSERLAVSPDEIRRLVPVLERAGALTYERSCNGIETLYPTWPARIYREGDFAFGPRALGPLNSLSREDAYRLLAGVSDWLDYRIRTLADDSPSDEPCTLDEGLKPGAPGIIGAPSIGGVDKPMPAMITSWICPDGMYRLVTKNIAYEVALAGQYTFAQQRAAREIVKHVEQRLSA